MGNLLQSYRNGAFDVESDTFDERQYSSVTGNRGLGAGKRAALQRMLDEGSGIHKSVGATQSVAPEADSVVVAPGLVNAIAQAIRLACEGFDRITDEVVACMELPDDWLGVDPASPDVEQRIVDSIRSGNERIFLAFSAANGG